MSTIVHTDRQFIDSLKAKDTPQINHDLRAGHYIDSEQQPKLTKRLVLEREPDDKP